MRRSSIPALIGAVVVALLPACADESPRASSPATGSSAAAGTTLPSTTDRATPATTPPAASIAPTSPATGSGPDREAPVAVLIGAGDIADDGDGDSATARLIESRPEALVFTTGDNAYDDGTSSQFAEYYDPTWGAFKDRTKPTIGNHDQHTHGSAGYFEYFGAAAGTPGEGWYSYDLGPWHVIHLNSECGGDGLASCDDQMQWLHADLAATSAECMIAIWHKPLFNSGRHRPEESFADEWAVLDDAGVDVVLNGHDHNYQRYAPQDAGGEATPSGMREFVVGTGGARLYEQTTSLPNLEEFYEGHGVLELGLTERAYSWTFIPTEGSYTDTGSSPCTGN